MKGRPRKPKNDDAQEMKEVNEMRDKLEAERNELDKEMQAQSKEDEAR